MSKKRFKNNTACTSNSNINCVKFNVSPRNSNFVNLFLLCMKNVRVIESYRFKLRKIMYI